MKMRWRLLFVAFILAFGTPAWATVETFTAAGASTWVAPAGVSTVQVECWGGGGAGSRSTTDNTGRGGGGGGGYAIRTAMVVTPGNTYNYTVGAAGTDGASPVNGVDSTFTGDSSVQCIGKAAASVAANTTGKTVGGTGSTGDTTHDGGAGADGVTSTSGGGGESGNTGSVGNSASGSTGGTGGDGGDGGAGHICSSGGGTAGSGGAAPGGGGGGGCRGNASKAGGDGAAGQIKLTYTAVPATGFFHRRAQ